MWYAELSPCTYFPEATELIAVGWLERGKPVPTGIVDRRVYDALVEMRREPWQPAAFAGVHACDLCLFDGEHGVANLFIPSGDVLYVCPELIVHYINAHAYAPPDEFCAAVLACPPMRSMPYLRAIRAREHGLLSAPTAKR